MGTVKARGLQSLRLASWGKKWTLHCGEDMAFAGGPVHLEAAKNSSLESSNLSQKNSNLPIPQKSCKARMGRRNQSSLWHIPFIRNGEERK